MRASSKKRATWCARSPSRTDDRSPNTASHRSERGHCCATSSTSRPSSRQPGALDAMHVAIIMDGNGRWATERGLPRTAGHVEGAKAVRATVESAARADIDVLTLYAFSSANWSRPAPEIAALMRLFGQYLFTETRRCVEQSIRINVIGRRDRLSESLLRSIEQSERLSASGSGMHLRIAVDYSSRDTMVEAARRASLVPDLNADAFHRLLHEVNHSTAAVSDV